MRGREQTVIGRAGVTGPGERKYGIVWQTTDDEIATPSLRCVEGLCVCFIGVVAPKNVLSVFRVTNSVAVMK